MIFKSASRKAVSLIAVLFIASPAPAELRVAVLGVTPKMDVVESWASIEDAEVTVTSAAKSFRIEKSDITIVAPTPTATLPEKATTLYRADAAIIVMDATEGPLPSLRDHVIIARQAQVPLVTMMFANVDLLWKLAPDDARELLDLEEEEFLNVLSLYEMGDARTPLFHDTAHANRAPTSATGGLGAVGRYFANRSSARQAASNIESQRNALGQVYFLADAEANGYGIDRAKEWSLELWTEGTSRVVDVYGAEVYGTADVGAVSIEAADPFPAYEGSRFLLFDDGHIVGLGVMTNLGD